MAKRNDGAGAKPSGSGLDRRRALELLLGGSTVGVAALLGGAVAQYLRPLELPEELALASFEPQELGLWDAKLVLVGGRPAVVVRTDEGFAALSAVCTHLGCIVKWKKSRRQFFCPCHGGRFAPDGRVLGGPPPKPLAKLEVEEFPDQVVVRPA